MNLDEMIKWCSEQAARRVSDANYTADDERPLRPRRVRQHYQKLDQSVFHLQPPARHGAGPVARFQLTARSLQTTISEVNL